MGNNTQMEEIVNAWTKFHRQLWDNWGSIMENAQPGMKWPNSPKSPEEYYFGTLSSMIGPGRALKSANLAEDTNITLKEACTRMGYCSPAEFDGMMDPVRRTFISH